MPRRTADRLRRFAPDALCCPLGVLVAGAPLAAQARTDDLAGELVASSTASRPPLGGPYPAQHVARTFVHDSVGRRLSSDDPDTDDPTNLDNSPVPAGLP